MYGYYPQPSKSVLIVHPNNLSEGREFGVAINYIFGTKWRYYGPKRDILDYWGTLIFCLLSRYTISTDKYL